MISEKIRGVSCTNSMNEIVIELDSPPTPREFADIAYDISEMLTPGFQHYFPEKSHDEVREILSSRAYNLTHHGNDVILVPDDGLESDFCNLIMYLGACLDTKHMTSYQRPSENIYTSSR